MCIRRGLFSLSAALTLFLAMMLFASDALLAQGLGDPGLIEGRTRLDLPAQVPTEEDIAEGFRLVRLTREWADESEYQLCDSDLCREAFAAVREKADQLEMVLVDGYFDSFAVAVENLISVSEEAAALLPQESEHHKGDLPIGSPGPSCYSMCIARRLEELQACARSTPLGPRRTACISSAQGNWVACWRACGGQLVQCVTVDGACSMACAGKACRRGDGSQGTCQLTSLGCGCVN